MSHNIDRVEALLSSELPDEGSIAAILEELYRKAHVASRHLWSLGRIIFSPYENLRESQADGSIQTLLHSNTSLGLFALAVRSSLNDPALVTGSDMSIVALVRFGGGESEAFASSYALTKADAAGAILVCHALAIKNSPLARTTAASVLERLFSEVPAPSVDQLHNIATGSYQASDMLPPGKSAVSTSKKERALILEAVRLSPLVSDPLSDQAKTLLRSLTPGGMSDFEKLVVAPLLDSESSEVRSTAMELLLIKYQW